MDGFAKALVIIAVLWMLAVFIVYAVGLPKEWQNNWGILAFMLGIPAVIVMIAFPPLVIGALVLTVFFAGRSSRGR